MTPESFAELLNGREYGEEIDREESALAKQHGLVVIYGASDDGIEFRGAISDDAGCYIGEGRGRREIAFTPKGIYVPPSHEEREALEKFGVLEHLRNQPRAQVTAHWCKALPDGRNTSWSYQAEFPHATFLIMEEDEVFCQGIVFRLTDAIPQTQPE